MKNSLIAVIFFLVGGVSHAQIFTLKSNIYVEGFSAGGKDRWLPFVKIDTAAGGVFIADLDKKLVSNTGKNISYTESLPITKIIRDEANHQIILETKPPLLGLTAHP